MDAKNVTAAKPKVSGSILNAPLGTVLPTDAVTELNPAFKSLGYTSEDGVSNTNSPESNSVKAWGGDTVLSSQTGKPDVFKFKLIEALNVDVQKTIYGDKNVTGTLEDGLAVAVNSEEQENKSWVIDTILKGGILKRMVLPSGKITAIGDVTHKDNDPIGYEVTLTLEPDSAGNTHYEYYKKVTTTQTEDPDTGTEESTGEETTGDEVNGDEVTGE